jgi:hypothetical protein
MVYEHWFVLVSEFCFAAISFIHDNSGHRTSNFFSLASDKEVVFNNETCQEGNHRLRVAKKDGRITE